eukprot:gene3313-4170_t
MDGNAVGSNVPLGWLVERLVESTYARLKAIMEELPNCPDAAKKKLLLTYLFNLKQRLLRLQVAVRWAVQVEAVSAADKVLHTLDLNDLSLSGSADDLVRVHQQLEEAKAPLYDVATSLDVLFNQGHSRLPAAISELRGDPPLNEGERAAVKDRLDATIRWHSLVVLVLDECPQELRIECIGGGTVTVCAAHEFQAVLTLGGGLGGWRIVSFKLLVAEKVTGKKPAALTLSHLQRERLGADISARMQCSSRPLPVLYFYMHALASSVAEESITRQVRTLVGTPPWKGAVRMGTLPHGVAGLAVDYWDSSKASKQVGGAPEEKPGAAGAAGTAAGTSNGGSGAQKTEDGGKVSAEADAEAKGRAPSMYIVLNKAKCLEVQHVPPVLDADVDAAVELEQGPGGARGAVVAGGAAEGGMPGVVGAGRELKVETLKLDSLDVEEIVKRAMRHRAFTHLKQLERSLITSKAISFIPPQDVAIIKDASSLPRLEVHTFTGRLMLRGPPRLLAAQKLHELEAMLNGEVLSDEASLEVPVRVLLILYNLCTVRHLESLAHLQHLTPVLAPSRALDFSALQVHGGASFVPPKVLLPLHPAHRGYYLGLSWSVQMDLQFALYLARPTPSSAGVPQVSKKFSIREAVENALALVEGDLKGGKLPAMASILGRRPREMWEAEEAAAAGEMAEREAAAGEAVLRRQSSWEEKGRSWPVRIQMAVHVAALRARKEDFLSACRRAGLQAFSTLDPSAPPPLTADPPAASGTSPRTPVVRLGVLIPQQVSSAFKPAPEGAPTQRLSDEATAQLELKFTHNPQMWIWTARAACDFFAGLPLSCVEADAGRGDAGARAPRYAAPRDPQDAHVSSVAEGLVVEFGEESGAEVLRQLLSVTRRAIAVQRCVGRLQAALARQRREWKEGEDFAATAEVVVEELGPVHAVLAVTSKGGDLPLAEGGGATLRLELTGATSDAGSGVVCVHTAPGTPLPFGCTQRLTELLAGGGEAQLAVQLRSGVLLAMHEAARCVQEWAGVECSMPSRWTLCLRYSVPGSHLLLQFRTPEQAVSKNAPHTTSVLLSEVAVADVAGSRTDGSQQESASPAFKFAETIPSGTQVAGFGGRTLHESDVKRTLWIEHAVLGKILGDLHTYLKSSVGNSL